MMRTYWLETCDGTRAKRRTLQSPNAEHSVLTLLNAPCGPERGTLYVTDRGALRVHNVPSRPERGALCEPQRGALCDPERGTL